MTYFNSVGYDKTHVLKFLRKPNIEAITKEDIATLVGIKNRIDDNALEASKSLPLTANEFEEEAANKPVEDFFNESSGDSENGKM